MNTKTALQFAKDIETVVLNGYRTGYDSFGNSWRIFKRKGYYDAIANMSKEEKLLRCHYLTANTLREMSSKLKNFGGFYKNPPVKG